MVHSFLLMEGYLLFSSFCGRMLHFIPIFFCVLCVSVFSLPSSSQTFFYLSLPLRFVHFANFVFCEPCIFSSYSASKPTAKGSGRNGGGREGGRGGRRGGRGGKRGGKSSTPKRSLEDGTPPSPFSTLFHRSPSGFDITFFLLIIAASDLNRRQMKRQKKMQKKNGELVLPLTFLTSPLSFSLSS